MAPRGTVDAGDAGLRVSGNLSIAALRIVNADNIKVGGLTTGVPTVQAPNIGGLTEASNTAGATSQQAMAPKQGSGNAQPSIVIVEVLGFGGGGDGSSPDDDQRKPGRQSRLNYDPTNTLRITGNGTISAAESMVLTDQEKKAFNADNQRGL